MSNTTSKLGDLFIDATREVVEKSRIKAQMNRLERIMESDRARLKTVYAEIGRLYMDGSIAKNKGKIEYAAKEIKHLKLRLERAEERYEQLQEAHSVDECKEAFRTELTATIKKAQDNTVIAAYKVKKKAQEVVKGKSAQPTVTVKGKSAISPDAIAKRTSETTAKKAAKVQPVTKDAETSISDLLAELDATEINISENNNIETIIAEVEEETAEAAVSADIIETQADDESAVSFDF